MFINAHLGFLARYYVTDVEEKNIDCNNVSEILN